MQSGAGANAGPALNTAVASCSGTRGMRVHREPPVHVIARFQIIVAPAIRPNPGRAQRARARAEYDSERFVVGEERQAGH